MMIGEEKLGKLQKTKVALFGLGGVGSFVAETLARSGVSAFVLVDNDIVSTTNINRQLIATHKSVGTQKTNAQKQKILEINPNAKVETINDFVLPNSNFDYLEGVNYIVDAIDTISGKIELCVQAKQRNIKIISAMGAGNKINPTQLEVCDIYKTSVCPLCKVMRKELRKRNIEDLKVVFSKEEPVSKSEDYQTLSTFETSAKRQIPASVVFVPAVMGIVIASEVFKDVIEA